MAKKEKSTIPVDHEPQPADETIAAGEHMDLEAMENQLETERRAGASNPTGVILASPSATMNPYVSEEHQGMEMESKTFGPPQYGSPDPATSASKLMTLEDGHPLDGLPQDHQAAISPDYGLEFSAEQVEATEPAEKLASENSVNLAEVQGTGQDGKITKGDVEDFIAARDNG